VIFSEHFGKKRAILLQTAAKWQWIKLRAIFSGALCTSTYPAHNCIKWHYTDISIQQPILLVLSALWVTTQSTFKAIA